MTATPAPARRDDRDTRMAWVCLAVAPVMFVVAFLAAEGTSTALGYTGVGAAPWWIAAVSLVVGLVIFSVPAAFALWFWRRGHRQGDDRAKVPALILVALSAGFLGINLLSAVVGVIVGQG